MKRHLTKAGVGLGATAVAMSSLLVGTGSSAHAAGSAIVVVNVVDQYDRPVSGIVDAFDQAGTVYLDGPGGGGNSVGSTHVFTVEPGGFSFLSIAGWSGFACAGASPCSTIPALPTSFTPVLDVVDGATSSYTLHVTVPSITGGGTVGSPLTLLVPQGLTAMQAAFAAFPGFPAGALTQQWVRGVTDVPGATDTSYTTTRDDGGQQLAARVTPSSGMSYVFAQLGVPIAPLSTKAIAIAPPDKTKTKTKVTIPKSIRVNDPVKVKVKVKATSGQPDGFVTVTIGPYKLKKQLQEGIVFIKLPRLKVGTYVLLTKYAGSEDFTKSKGKKTTITVHA